MSAYGLPARLASVQFRLFSFFDLSFKELLIYLIIINYFLNVNIIINNFLIFAAALNKIGLTRRYKTMNTLGQRIKKARENAGLMQSELAAKIGVKSSGVISNWETDKSKPDADKIVLLCNVLGVSCSYLLDYYGSEELSSREQRLVSLFRDMNEEGQDQLLQYSEFLLQQGYIKSDQPVVVEKTS